MILSSEQADFIYKEFDLKYPANTQNPMSIKTWRLIKDACFMIECEETDENGPTSERGRIAISICDMNY